IAHATVEAPPDIEGDHPTDLMDAYGARAHEVLQDIRGNGRVKLFFGPLIPVIVILITGGAGALAAWRAGWSWSPDLLVLPGIALGVGIVGAMLCWWLQRRQLQPKIARLTAAIATGRSTGESGEARAASDRDEHARQIVERRDTDIAEAKGAYEPILEEIATRRARHIERIHARYPKRIEELKSLRRKDLEALNDEVQQKHEEITATHESTTSAAEREYEESTAEAKAIRTDRHSALVDRWTRGANASHDVLRTVGDEVARRFPAWDDPFWTDWEPPLDFAPAIEFGRMHIDMNALEGGLSNDPALAWPGATTFDLPALLAFPDACSLLIEAGDDGGEQAVETLQTAMFRLLTALPPGKVRFTIIDPVGLGQNFAGFMHLADTHEALVTDRIWTEARHIEQRLVDLTDHMENVIQKYLRNEYETIAEYNHHAGEIAEPYRFLVIANFPVNMSETAAKRLASIVNSGPRCGVYTLITQDTRQAVPKGIEMTDVKARSINLVHADGRFKLADEDYGELDLTLDVPPDPSFMIPRLKKIGEASKDASRVEVPFRVISPERDDWWTGDATRELQVPLGRSGATSLQQLGLGRGTAQHALIAGKTGSGKSTLLHVLITNIALWFRPDEVEVYLVDFKKGVEFKAYAAANLPHARAIAIESDREFGLSVLRRLDGELKKRGDTFRDLGVQDLAGYRGLKDPALPPIPRTLLIVDEFQELFVEDDRIGQDAALLLDRLVRQGRAFGIHLVLGSQTLGGAYSLAKSTMGQMGVRIALQCSESDSYLILSEDNAGARLLSRPGEAIYNGASGLVEGNSPFQICWLPDETRDVLLKEVAARAANEGYQPAEPQIIFEGNAPADIAKNDALRRALATSAPVAEAVASHAWLGEAIAIKDPTAAVFRRQSGGNLLIVGQRDESALAIISSALLSLAAQSPTPTNGAAPRYHLFNGLLSDSPYASLPETLVDVMPTGANLVNRRDLADTLQSIVTEIEDRQNRDASADPAMHLFFLGLQRFRNLRPSDDFSFSMDEDAAPSPDKLLKSILADGPTVGVHVIAWCDTATNVDRSLDRQAMREFDMRVVFQMSATDSTNLIDAPTANKLGLRHALFYSEEQGVLEKFRPYNLPEQEWLDEVRNALDTRGASVQ
ncbi:MAG: FtsK/SpoIIIE domain-containing protein, partial [Planctomycetota bacterium]